MSRETQESLVPQPSGSGAHRPGPCDRRGFLATLQTAGGEARPSPSRRHAGGAGQGRLSGSASWRASSPPPTGVALKLDRSGTKIHRVPSLRVLAVGFAPAAERSFHLLPCGLRPSRGSPGTRLPVLPFTDCGLVSSLEILNKGAVGICALKNNENDRPFRWGMGCERVLVFQTLSFSGRTPAGFAEMPAGRWGTAPTAPPHLITPTTPVPPEL